jgi:DNA replication protein DnaC
MDEFSEYEQDQAVPERVKKAAEHIVGTLFDPWNAGEIVECENCGGAGGFDEKGKRRTPEATHFRTIPPVNVQPGQEIIPDRYPRLCFECAQETEEREERKQAARQNIERIIPPLFEDKRLSNFDVPPGDATALAACNAWRLERGGGRSLYLYGGTGLGKTHLAAAIAIREILEGRSVVFLEWSDFLGKLRATFGSKYQGRTEQDIQADLERADLVVIDDIGGGKSTEWAAERLWLIVNGRHVRRRQLVITSNIPLDSIGAEVDLRRWVGGAAGQRIVSRLSSMTTTVRVSGKDVREQMELPK